MLRQNILLTNANKSNVYNLNNDITLNFPTNLFFKPPQFIELLDLDLNAEISILGNSNNSLKVIYKNITYLIIVEYDATLKTDFQLAKALEKGLNNPRNPNNPNLFLAYNGNLVFKVTDSSIENTVTNHYIEREAFTAAFTIDVNESCTLDFNTKDSIGPLMGFGNGIYQNITNISGSSTQSISAYNFIDIINSSGSTNTGLPAGPYPNYNDINCKMILYDSNKKIIPNLNKKFDTTISLNQGQPLKSYESIGEILLLLEDEMNLYKNYFTPAANFVVSYDNVTKKVTIKNTTGAKFGIGFDFANSPSYRSMSSDDGIIWRGGFKDYSVPLNNWTCLASGIVNGSPIVVSLSSSGTNNRVITSTNGTNWVSRDSPNQAYWSSVAASNNIIVAIASSISSNNVATSLDGETWSLAPSLDNKKWTSIIWSPQLNLFVIVASSGSSNRVMTSSDGITWIARASAANNDWTSICWSPQLNLFVAVASSGINNRIMTSSNGITWNIQTSPADNNWTSVCWSPQLNLFVAVASSGINNRIMTSSDGITWNIQISPADNNWTSVCWSSQLNLFVAVSSSGINNRVMTSTNGINWVLRTSPADNEWSSVTWIQQLNRFISVSNSGTTNRIMYSENGLTWFAYNIPFNFNWNSIIWYNNYLITAGFSLGKSSDGYNWNNSKFLIDNDWSSVCWSPTLNLFVAVSSTVSNYDSIAISTNGTEWVTVIAPVLSIWTSVCWSSTLNLFIAVASYGLGNRVMRSSDGIIWTIGSTPADNDWTSVCWSSNLNLFVAVASSGSGNRVMTSPNGINWNLQVSAADYLWTSVTWGGLPGQKKFVAVASSGIGNRIMTSSNGINWSLQTSVADNDWSSVCWSGQNLFVAVASSGLSKQIMYSSDGITWLSTEAEINLNWNSIISAEIATSVFKLISVGGGLGNTSGSLHYILGLEQKSYIDLQEIVSVTDILCFDNIFADDYVLICSDISNNATDINVIGIGNADNIKSNNILFAIPLKQTTHFRPVDSSYYKINIAASNFSLGYKNKKFNENNPNLVNFYLRLLSGRHITSTSQFAMQISFLF